MSDFEQVRSTLRSIRRKSHAEHRCRELPHVTCSGRGQIRTDLSTDGVVVPGGALTWIVRTLRDRLIDEFGAFQNRDRHAHNEHEQRNPRRQVLPSSVVSVVHEPKARSE